MSFLKFFHHLNLISPTQIWNELDHLNCDKESCFASSLNMKTLNFAPKHPESWNTNPTEWLSSYDISGV